MQWVNLQRKCCHLWVILSKQVKQLLYTSNVIFLRANRKKIIFQFWHKIPGKYILYFILLGIDRSF